MKRRRLRFDSFDAAIDDIDHLYACGYEQAGRWDLPQVCEHLTAVMRMSLEGFERFDVPWPVRVVGRVVFKPAVLWSGRMLKGVPAPARIVSPPESTRPAMIAVSHCVATMRQVRDHDGTFHPSPLMGPMTAQQWRRMHLIHAAHHLSFLVLKG